MIQKNRILKRSRWLKLLKYRQTWAFIIGKFLTDPIWWFYLYWLGLFLNNNFGLILTGLGLPLIVIYTMTSIGSIGGGWMSGAMINRGVSVNNARKITMLIFALLVVPVVMATNVTSLWTAVGIIGSAVCGAPGMVCQHFHNRIGYVPEKSSRFCRWAWRFRRFYRRYDIFNFFRIYRRSDRKLHGIIHHLWFSVFACFRYYATIDI